MIIIYKNNLLRYLEGFTNEKMICKNIWNRNWIFHVRIF